MATKKIYAKPMTERHESKNVVQGSLYRLTLYKTTLYTTYYYTSLYKITLYRN